MDYCFRFKSDLFHPNIYADGRVNFTSAPLFASIIQNFQVCISILHPPGADPLGYESSSERWSPVQSIEKILLSGSKVVLENSFISTSIKIVLRKYTPCCSYVHAGRAKYRVPSQCGCCQDVEGGQVKQSILQTGQVFFLCGNFPLESFF